MNLKKAVYSADNKLAFKIFSSAVFCLAFFHGTLFADANSPKDIDTRVQEILKISPWSKKSARWFKAK